MLRPCSKPATHHRVASLYDMPSANADQHLKPVSEWNTAMDVSKRTYVEHWLNSVKVLEHERGGKGFMNALMRPRILLSSVPENALTKFIYFLEIHR